MSHEDLLMDAVSCAKTAEQHADEEPYVAMAWAEIGNLYVEIAKMTPPVESSLRRPVPIVGSIDS